MAFAVRGPADGGPGGRAAAGPAQAGTGAFRDRACGADALGAAGETAQFLALRARIVLRCAEGGTISGPALAEAVREEPNPKYGNIRMPRTT